MSLPVSWSLVSSQDVPFWSRLLALPAALAAKAKKFYCVENYAIVIDSDDQAFVVEPNNVGVGDEEKVFEVNTVSHLPHLSAKGIKKIISCAFGKFYFIDQQDQVSFVPDLRQAPQSLFENVEDKPEQVKVLSIKVTHPWHATLMTDGTVFCWEHSSGTASRPRKIQHFESIVSIDVFDNGVYGLDHHGKLFFYLPDEDYCNYEASPPNAEVITSFLILEDILYVRTLSGRLFSVTANDFHEDYIETQLDQALPDIYKVHDNMFVAWKCEEDIFHVGQSASSVVSAMPAGLSFSALIQCLARPVRTPTLMHLSTSLSDCASSPAHQLLVPAGTRGQSIARPLTLCPDTAWPLLRLLPASILSSIDVFKHYEQVAFVIDTNSQVFFTCNFPIFGPKVCCLQALSDKKIVDIVLETSSFRAYFLSQSGEVFAFVNEEQGVPEVSRLNTGGNIEEHSKLTRVTFNEPGGVGCVPEKIVSIKSSSYQTMALSERHTVFRWSETLRPVAMEPRDVSFVEFDLFQSTSVCLSADRSIIRTWNNFDCPEHIKSSATINSIACLQFCLCFTTDAGELFCWEHDSRELTKIGNAGYKQVCSPDGHVLIAQMSDGSIRARWSSKVWYTHQQWQTVVDVVGHLQVDTVSMLKMKMMVETSRKTTTTTSSLTEIRVGLRSKVAVQVNETALTKRSKFFEKFFGSNWQVGSAARVFGAVSLAQLQKYLAFVEGTPYKFESWTELLEEIELANYLDDQQNYASLLQLVLACLCGEDALEVFELISHRHHTFHLFLPAQLADTVAKFVLFNIDFIRTRPAFHSMSNKEAKEFLRHFQCRNLAGDLDKQVAKLKTFYSK